MMLRLRFNVYYEQTKTINYTIKRGSHATGIDALIHVYNVMYMGAHLYM